MRCGFAAFTQSRHSGTRGCRASQSAQLGSLTRCVPHGEYSEHTLMGWKLKMFPHPKHVPTASVNDIRPLSLLSEKRRGQAGAMMQPDYQEAGVLSMFWSPAKH
jgi:hypothetical protein